MCGGTLLQVAGRGRPKLYDNDRCRKHAEMILRNVRGSRSAVQEARDNELPADLIAGLEQILENDLRHARHYGLIEEEDG